MKAHTLSTVRRPRKANELLEHELDLAREIQAALLPTELPVVPGLRIAALNQPARVVSGDVYDVIRIDENRVVILCADVCGKGFGAALLAAQVQSYFRAMLQAASVVSSALEFTSMSVLAGKLGPLPAHVVTQMNSTACRNLNLPGRFATLFFAELDGRNGKVRYVNAGHNPPLLLPLGASPELLSTGGLPIGLFENAAYETGTVTIPPEATLLVYTDGVIEARDSHDEEFGLVRLIELCADAKGNVQQLLSSIVAAVENWSGSLAPADDITLVAVAREG